MNYSTENFRFICPDSPWKLGLRWFGVKLPEGRVYFSVRNFKGILYLGPLTIYWRR